MQYTIRVILIALITVTAAVAQSAQSNNATTKAQELLQQARAAVGGEAKRKALRSLSVSFAYRWQIEPAPGRVVELTGEVEFDFLLPDKYRKTTVSRDTTRVEAYDGQKAWDDVSVSSGTILGDRSKDAQIEATFQRRVRAEFARSMLVWLLAAPPSTPLEFRYAGVAKAAAERADALDVTGPDGFAARLFLDQQTHRPLLLSFRQPVRRAGMNTSGSAQSATAKPEEEDVQWFLADYREVDGISFPHQLTKAVNGKTNEEWTLKRLRLNPPLKPEKFARK